MSLRKFLEDLRTTGRVRVPKFLGFTGKEVVELEAALLVLDEAARSEAACEAPELSVPSAAWAALALYRGCQFLVFRDLGEELVTDIFSRACPERPSPSVCWSVDLALRYLPDLCSLARGIAQSDPLVVCLARLAVSWPLSSVGVSGPGPYDVSAFIDHPALRQLYADRIIERADSSRLDDPRALEAVRASLGGFPELAPRLSRAIFPPTVRE